ncbi:hypothetical protein Pmani_022341 [Petrolisthes manimaculis]|uniref:C2H2-type domain-containing protein n=1 Tax=Petrolisthes manimaculis TaxID=1843537 RepID=A0AAE1PCX2_9EUCA|nr:hypothetical protein Pmani_022341 [Petrolisthes manimaculis]
MIWKHDRPAANLDLKRKMSGGRRKSRKPQKWEDYVADEELANIEEELEMEEKARMLSAEEMPKPNKEEEEEMEKEEEVVVKKEGGLGQALKMEVEEWSDGNEEEESQLEIVLAKEEVMEEEDTKQLHTEMKEVSVKQEVELHEDQEQLDDPLGVSDAECQKGVDTMRSVNNSSMVGDCGVCGIQLRDWSSAHSHLRFHRLSHVPDCVSLPDKQDVFRVNCKVCQRSCQTKEVLAYHAYTEHFNNQPLSSDIPKNSCPFCTATFNSTISFHRHLDFTIITFKCQMCGELVDQENKFYLHLVQCTRISRPGVTHVLCCVCGILVKLEKLYSHLLHHSTLLNFARHLASTTKRKRCRSTREEGVANGAAKKKKQQQQQQRLSSFRPFLCELCDRKFVVYTEFKRHLYSHSKSRAYVCTHCGRGYCQKNTLIVHLYTYHNAYPTAEEITPQEDTMQRWCEGCGRVGFTNRNLLIRHYILRCSQRNGLQNSFAAIINNIAKEDNSGFLEVMYSSSLRSYLPLAAKAWPSPPCVKELLERLQEDPPPKLPPPPGRREASEFTDIQLLAYLEKFEAKHRKRDKELEFLLKFQSKDTSGDQQSRETQTLQDSPQLTPEVPYYPVTLPSSPQERNMTRDDAVVTRERVRVLGKDHWEGNLDSIVHHLRSGGEKRRAGTGDDGPLDICLVTSSTNTQVTFTPATHAPSTLHPPKVARTPSHKPTVSEIQSLYPGVAVLGDVDFSRLPSLLLQMASMMDHRFGQAIEDINHKDLQRLEFEAQLLREAEPFYLSDSLPSYLSNSPTSILSHIKSSPSSTSPDHSRFTLKNGLCAPNPSALARIVDELTKWKIEFQTSTPQTRTMRVESVPSEAQVARLLREAQDLLL